MFAATKHFATATQKVGDASFSSVTALLHFNTDLADSSSLASAWTASGSSAVSATQAKFGAKSLFVNGGYIYPGAASSNFAFGTGDFTVEMWLYPTSGSGAQVFWDTRPDALGNYTSFQLNAGGYIQAFINSTATYITDTAFASTNAWNHVAICRTGGSIKAYVNGVWGNVSLANSTNFQDPGSSSYIRIGTGINGFNKFPGYIDEVRITKGVARYTANFTAPSAPFPDSA